jgi:hypothetical protein
MATKKARSQEGDEGCEEEKEVTLRPNVFLEKSPAPRVLLFWMIESLILVSV